MNCWRSVTATKGWYGFNWIGAKLLTSTDINMQLTRYYENTGNIVCWVEGYACHGSLPISSTDNTVVQLPVNIQEITKWTAASPTRLNYCWPTSTFFKLVSYITVQAKLVLLLTHLTRPICERPHLLVCISSDSIHILGLWHTLYAWCGVVRDVDSQSGNICEDWKRCSNTKTNKNKVFFICAQERGD